jgi:hypothetical protein
MHEPGSWEISGTPGLSRFPTSFPRGATLDIVCLKHPTEPEVRASNNVKSGTSGERGPFPDVFPKIRNFLGGLGGIPNS